MRNLLKKILPRNAKSQLGDVLKTLTGGSKYIRLHYSQSGEDTQLYNLLRPDVNPEGFYVDVGAFHPTHLSNTHLLYINGWRGLNIDATPGSMAAFRKARPLDINLEQAVSDREEELVFYEHASRAESSFDTSHSLGHRNKSELKQTRLRTKSLVQILREAGVKKVDVMTVDAEGFDYRILSAFDFETYQPKLIAVEQVADDVEAILESDIYKLMRSRNYSLVARTVVGGDVGTSIYQRKEKG